MKNRASIATLAVTAAMLVAIVGFEGFSGTAKPPVKGDVPTLGFGSTTHEDGAPVMPGETIAPVPALRLAIADIEKKETALKQCLSGVFLTPHEYDAFVSLAYNVGTGAVCRSSIVPKLKAGHYLEACQTILDFTRVQGRDCCDPQNKRFCGGICARRKAEYQTCLGVKER